MTEYPPHIQVLIQQIKKKIDEALREVCGDDPALIEATRAEMWPQILDGLKQAVADNRAQRKKIN